MKGEGLGAWGGGGRGEGGAGQRKGGWGGGGCAREFWRFAIGFPAGEALVLSTSSDSELCLGDCLGPGGSKQTRPECLVPALKV